MLKFTNLTIRNFLSVGNNTQALKLDQGELVLVLGENLDLGGDEAGDNRNGVGKSMWVNAISYALFSWTVSPIKKSNLINNSNGKSMLVTLEFESNGKKYKIVRGLKPRILEFYEEGELKSSENSEEDSDDFSQGDSRETQKEIEKIIGMTYEMFCQLIAVSTYTPPFLFQKSADQRLIIEQLLGITLLSKKAEKLKDEMKLSHEFMLKEEARIHASESANKRIQDQINILLKTQKNWQEHKDIAIIKLQREIEKLSNIDIDKELSLHSEWEKYQKIEGKQDELLSQKRQLEFLQEKEQVKLDQVEKDLVSLGNQYCQTCGQKLNTEIQEKLIQETTGKKKKSEIEIKTILDGISLIQKEINELPTKEKPEKTSYLSVANAHDHHNRLMLLTQELKQKEAESDPYQAQIDSMKNTALEVIDKSALNEMSRFIDHQEFLLKLLTSKDSFIRKRIIEQNLDYLNGKLGHYLAILGLPHEVVFQNDLSVSISEFGRELSPGNLSRGEMSRLNLALGFAFRDVWENLYQTVNVLILDEVIDSGIDNAGTDCAVKLLKNMSREQGKDIWLISHKDYLSSKCSKICRVIKSGGYTHFELDD
ncbi:DNA double-strand break repair Rad50 ATPase [uncultured archaeon]|nr:DNA double-strand break repair Rad50 ATPase [uncultured archaeon]